MSNMLDWGPVRLAGDALFEQALICEGKSIDERLRVLHATSWILANEILTVGLDERDRSEEVDYIIGGKTLACLPSVERSIYGKPHDREVAKQVGAGLLELAGYVSHKRLYDSDNPRVIGAVSELSVLSVIWWAIENGYTDERSRALPARIKQDVGTKNGLRNGFDIVFKEGVNGQLKRHNIQVKTSSNPVSRTYNPNIPVVAVSKIVPLSHKKKANKAIFDSLVRGSNQCYVLGTSWDNIKSEVDKTKASRHAERTESLSLPVGGRFRRKPRHYRR